MKFLGPSLSDSHLRTVLRVDSSVKPTSNSFFFFLIFPYVFLAAPGLPATCGLFTSCSEEGLLLVAVSGLLTAVASPVAERRLYTGTVTAAGELFSSGSVACV